MIQTFQDRFAMGVAHENAVRDLLEERGWEVTLFNQFDLRTGQRTVVRKSLDAEPKPNLLRFAPDFIAAIERFGTYHRYFIDPKTCSEKNRSSPYVTCGEHALAGQTVWAELMNTEVIYVFHDYSTATPADFDLYGEPGPQSRDGLGSGQPYIRMPKMLCKPFHVRFGGEPA